jgi:hypothetical protein
MSIKKFRESREIGMQQRNGIVLKLEVDAHATREDQLIILIVCSCSVTRQIYELVGHCSFQVSICNRFWGCAHKLAKQIELFMDLDSDIMVVSQRRKGYDRLDLQVRCQ